jgi:hypothetical protein
MRVPPSGPKISGKVANSVHQKFLTNGVTFLTKRVLMTYYSYEWMNYDDVCSKQVQLWY